MRKEYIILATVLLLIVVLAEYKYAQTHPVLETSINFITAAAAGNNTKEYSTMQTQHVAPARVDNIECNVLAYGGKWAKTRARVELTLADQTVDVNWYELELVKNGEWKVSNIVKTSPVIDGFSSRLSDESLSDIKAVFNSYLMALQGANYQEAKRYLAGPAREKFEQYSPQAGKAPMFKTYSGLQVQSLWTDRKYVATKLNYLVDNRPVEITTGFYKTTQGWKIVNTK